MIEVDELRDAARRVLGGSLDRQEILRTPASIPQLNKTLWRTIVELGWLGLCVPEAHGGLGQSFIALSTLYRELGRSLPDASFASAAIGLDVLSEAAAHDVAAKTLEAGIAGEAFVVSTTSGRGRVEIAARGDSVVLDGTLRGVLAARDATHLLVPIGQTEPAIALVALPNPHIAIVPRATWDMTRGEVCDVTFSALEIAPDEILLRGPAAERALLRAAAHFDLALACDAVGGAEQIFEETLAYMETRKQFGRAIASFQALKHRCADLRTSMEAARALVDAACQSMAAGQGAWRAMAASARLQAGAVYRQVTEEAVQLHGGIGFTWEQSCHLFLKRARLSEALGGTAEQRKDELAVTMLRAAHERTGSLLGDSIAGA